MSGVGRLLTRYIAVRATRLPLFRGGETSVRCCTMETSGSEIEKGSWKKPDGVPPAKLRVYNSLTRSKVTGGLWYATVSIISVGRICSFEWAQSFVVQLWTYSV